MVLQKITFEEALNRIQYGDEVYFQSSEDQHILRVATDTRMRQVCEADSSVKYFLEGQFYLRDDVKKTGQLHE